MSFNLITKDKRFFPLFWTQFLGAFNDNVFKNALVMLITFKSVQALGLNSKTLVALCGGIFILPFILFSAVAGQIADKFEKNKVIRVTKYTELLFMALAVVGIYLQNFPFLIFVLFLMGAQSAFFGPLKYGVIPELLTKEELVKGNAFVSMGTFIAILLGTILGGMSAVGDNAQTLLPIYIIILAIAGILASKKIVTTEAKDPAIKIDFSLLRPTLDIVRITKENRRVFTFVLSISWYWFLGAAILSLIPPMVKDILMGSEQVGTMFLGLFTVGMGLGSLFTEKISLGEPDIGLINFSFLAMSLALVDLFFSLNTWSSYHTFEATTLFTIREFLQKEGAIRVTLDMLVLAFFGGSYIVTLYSLIQIESDKKKMARVVAGNNIWNALFMVLAAVSVMGFHSLKFSIAQIFLVLGGLNFVAGLWFYLKDGYWAWRFLFYIFVKFKYKVRIHGLENIPTDRPCVVICNHQSFIDWGILMAVFRRPLRFVIDHVHYYNPLLTWLFKTGKLVPIATKKDNEEVLNSAYDMISDHLQNDQMVLIFPEGWLTGDGNLKKFQPGVLKILNKDPVDVLPVGITGLWESWSSRGGKGAFKGLPNLKRREIHLHIGKPISAQEYESESARQKISEMTGIAAPG